MRLAASFLVTMTVLSEGASAQAGAPAARNVRGGVEETWTGNISDSSCKAKHEPGGEAGLPETPKDCTIACVRGGSKYVFVTADNKIFLIAKQDDPALQANAGAKVVVTGSVANDVLTIAKIEPAK